MWPVFDWRLKWTYCKSTISWSWQISFGSENINHTTLDWLIPVTHSSSVLHFNVLNVERNIFSVLNAIGKSFYQTTVYPIRPKNPPTFENSYINPLARVSYESNKVDSSIWAFGRWLTSMSTSRPYVVKLLLTVNISTTYRHIIHTLHIHTPRIEADAWRFVKPAAFFTFYCETEWSNCAKCIFNSAMMSPVYIFYCYGPLYWCPDLLLLSDFYR